MHIHPPKTFTEAINPMSSVRQHKVLIIKLKVAAMISKCETVEGHTRAYADTLGYTWRMGHWGL